MHADVGDVSAGADDCLADAEGGGDADRLDGDIHSLAGRGVMTFSAALPSVLLTTSVAPNCLATSRRLSSRSITMSFAGA